MPGHYPYPDDFDQEARQFEELRKEAIDEMQGDISWLMSHERGRLFMARMQRVCRVGRDVFVTNGTQNAFEQGRQSVGNWLNQLIDELEDGDELRKRMVVEDRNRRSRFSSV